jgi:hypothetical protein
MRSALILFAFAGACGPRARIPSLPAPESSPGAVSAADDAAQLARQLAPVLFLQRDEWFPLERVVAVVHPERRIIGYHLLWRDDIHGSWIPFTVPTDQEIVWVGYDSARTPNALWAYWHGKILRTDWTKRGTALVSVQWGKHGSLPHGIVESDLPKQGTLNLFYAFGWLGLPDIWLGRLTRRGPMCFCHGYGRYRDFSRPLPLTDRIDVVLLTEDPNPALVRVFGRPFSKKPRWPQVE